MVVVTCTVEAVDEMQTEVDRIKHAMTLAHHSEVNRMHSELAVLLDQLKQSQSVAEISRLENDPIFKLFLRASPGESTLILSCF